MKKFTLILILAFFTLNANTGTPIENTIETSTPNDLYNAIAYTDNGYAQNYSLAITVEAYGFMGSYTVNDVFVDGQSVSWGSVILSSNRYYVNYGGNRYYFTF